MVPTYLCYTSSTLTGTSVTFDQLWTQVVNSQQPWDITDGTTMEQVWNAELSGIIRSEYGATFASAVHLTNPRPVASMPEWTDPHKQTMLALNAICVDDLPVDFTDPYARWIACVMNECVRARYPGSLNPGDLAIAEQFDTNGITGYDHLESALRSEQVAAVRVNRWTIFHIPFPHDDVSTSRTRSVDAPKLIFVCLYL